MLFTLLTRVERLNQITFCGFSPENLRELLKLKTYWHASVDDWCFKVNLLKTLPNPPPPIPEPSFYDAAIQGLPPHGVNTVYIIESKEHSICYVGSTGTAQRRLSQHNAKRGALETAWTQDWVMKACILGFTTGQEGRGDAYRVESLLRRKPLVPHPLFFEWLRMAQYLVEELNADRAIPLWVQVL